MCSVHVCSSVTTCMVLRLADTRSMCSVHVFCACVLECVCMHTHLLVYAACMRVCIYIDACMCVHLYMYACIHLRMHACIHPCRCVCVCVCVCACVRARACACACACACVYAKLDLYPSNYSNANIVCMCVHVRVNTYS